MEMNRFEVIDSAVNAVIEFIKPMVLLKLGKLGDPRGTEWAYARAYVPRGLADWPMGTLRVRAVNVVNDDNAVSKGLTKAGRWMLVQEILAATVRERAVGASSK